MAHEKLQPEEDNLKYLGIVSIVAVAVVIAAIIIFSIFVKK